MGKRERLLTESVLVVKSNRTFHSLVRDDVSMSEILCDDTASRFVFLGEVVFMSRVACSSGFLGQLVETGSRRHLNKAFFQLSVV